MQHGILILASTALIYASGIALADCVGKAREKVAAGLWDDAFVILDPCAENSDRDAQAQLGALYALPQVGRQSDELTVYWTKRAAELGSPLALFNLASFYETGKFELPADLKEAARIYHIAVEAGHDSARFRLAQMSLFGRGMSRNQELALDLMSLRSEKLSGLSGDDEYQIAAMYKSGYDGSGEGADLTLARHFYDISARKGNRGAQYFSGAMLLASGQTEEIANGVLWMAIAAKKGHPLALEEMKVIYEQFDPRTSELIQENALTCLENSYHNCP